MLIKPFVRLMWFSTTFSQQKHSNILVFCNLKTFTEIEVLEVLL